MADPRPEWSDGLPLCSERCPAHDGKRCDLLGHRPDAICEPAVKRLREVVLSGAVRAICAEQTRVGRDDAAPGWQDRYDGLNTAADIVRRLRDYGERSR